jgi:hypothetical protein
MYHPVWVLGKSLYGTGTGQVNLFGPIKYMAIPVIWYDAQPYIPVVFVCSHMLENCHKKVMIRNVLYIC